MTKLISEQISHGRQTISCELIYNCDGTMIKFSIKADSVKHQSHAQALVFHKEALTWNGFYSIFPSLMKSEMNYQNKVTISDFKEDIETLKLMAKNILGIKVK